MSTDLSWVQWPARTARLEIRPAGCGDADATWRYRCLDEVSRWIATAPTTEDEYRAYFTEPERLAKTLLIELHGVVIGDLMVAKNDALAQTEVGVHSHGVQAALGWCLDPQHGGGGYATEAVQELLRICFHDLGLRRVTAVCFADNTASWKLMERLGMRREAHTIGDALHRNGEWLDGYGYAMLADEWLGSEGQIGAGRRGIADPTPRRD